VLSVFFPLLALSVFLGRVTSVLSALFSFSFNFQLSISPPPFPVAGRWSLVAAFLIADIWSLISVRQKENG
jgi:hypothetical protein